jgi:hypothetical protein
MSKLIQLGSNHTGTYDLTNEVIVLSITPTETQNCVITVEISDLDGYETSWKFWVSVDGYKTEYSSETEDLTEVLAVLNDIFVEEGRLLEVSVLSSNQYDTSCSCIVKVFTDATASKTVSEINLDETQSSFRTIVQQQTEKESIREAVEGTWTDEDGNAFDLTITDI